MYINMFTRVRQIRRKFYVHCEKTNRYSVQTNQLILAMMQNKINIRTYPLNIFLKGREVYLQQDRDSRGDLLILKGQSKVIGMPQIRYKH
jgi:hypothetical protein